MTRDRVIVALLAVFCVLLAMNLVKGEPEVQAGHGPPADFLSAAPTVVAGSAVGLGTVIDQNHKLLTGPVGGRAAYGAI